MFGKKKVNNSLPKDYRCAACGLDCRDGTSLERHMNWAHPGDKKQGSATTEKKV